MLNKKRTLASFGAAVFILSCLFLIVLTSRSLKGPEWISTLIIWIYFWPVMLFGHFFQIPYLGRARVVALAISVGLITDTAVLFGLAYAALSLIKWKSHQAIPLLQRHLHSNEVTFRG
jgi:membrane-anchored protein YejM (alkaline phosphatase superfamily)